MTGIIPLAQRFIAGNSTRTVSARKLHEFLGVRRDFSNWIRSRIKQYGFTENQDYIKVFAKTGENPKGGRPSAEYYLTLDMAKELAMVERTERGREARRYFIDCEKQLIEKKAQPRLSDQTSQRALLPEPDLSTELRSAINRKAHALSLQGYDTIRNRLTKWVEQWNRDGGERQAMQKLNDYNGKAGEMVFINAEALWNICAGIGINHVGAEHAMAMVRQLEEETGQKWQNRPQ